MYTRDGDIEQQQISRDTWVTLASHTVTEGVRDADLTMSIYWLIARGAGARDHRICVNGEQIVIDDATASGTTVTATTIDLEAGDDVTFDAHTNASGVNPRIIMSGSWSVSGELAVANALHFGGDVSRMWWGGEVTAVYVGSEPVWVADT